MPIVLVSVDSKNEKLDDFKSMEKTIHTVFVSGSHEAIALSSMVGKYENRLQVDALNPRRPEESDQDVHIRFQSLLNIIRGMDIDNAMIISHHSVFNVWKPETIGDEWEIIEM
jgi:hypothetical protein